ncbi:MAG: DUF1738 domain-containing protein [Rhodanobacter sp.]|nr:DUF1738 domain-containing protein [Rhodanobacter sp.]
MATATAIKRPHRAKEESHNEAPPKKSDYAQEVAAKIITQLEAGTAPWQRPWKAGMRPPPGQGMPYNAVSGNGYRGMNAVNLLLEQQEKGYQDDRWLTYQQALDVGGQVRKGAKGTTVLYYKFNDREKGAAPEGESTAADGRRSSVSVFYARVFNGDQIEGMPPVKVREPPKEKERHELCEKLIADAGVPIHHDGGDQAYYHPIKDSIHLPLRGAFKTSDGFYATALHELGHSTGHPSRLKRDLTGRFGTPEYAREELTAEISSMMMGERLGIGHDPSQHVAYVKSWIGLLKDDPKVILKACSEAEKVCTFHPSIRTREASFGRAGALEHRREEGPLASPGEGQGARADAGPRPGVLTPARGAFRTPAGGQARGQEAHAHPAAESGHVVVIGWPGGR